MNLFQSWSLDELERKYPSIHNAGEREQLIRLVREQSLHLADPTTVRIVEIGCGHGANLRALTAAGFSNVLGVDINPETVARNIANGLDCVQADAFAGRDVDLMIMAHVIEHLQPTELKHFLERYLDTLKTQGVLIVSTPLIWEGFYQDFDHVKPYYPKGLLALFDQQGKQVAYYGRQALQLEGIPWVRKMPYVISGHKYFLLQPLTRFERWLQVLMNFLFYKSQRAIGKPNGWMGVFRKVSI